MPFLFILLANAAISAPLLLLLCLLQARTAASRQPLLGGEAGRGQTEESLAAMRCLGISRSPRRHATIFLLALLSAGSGVLLVQGGRHTAAALHSLLYQLLIPFNLLFTAALLRRLPARVEFCGALTVCAGVVLSRSGPCSAPPTGTPTTHRWATCSTPSGWCPPRCTLCSPSECSRRGTSSARTAGRACCRSPSSSRSGRCRLRSAACPRAPSADPTLPLGPPARVLFSCGSTLVTRQVRHRRPRVARPSARRGRPLLPRHRGRLRGRGARHPGRGAHQHADDGECAAAHRVRRRHLLFGCLCPRAAALHHRAQPGRRARHPPPAQLERAPLRRCAARPP